ncbi:MAG: AAA family ATPase [Bacteroides sp.]
MPTDLVRELPIGIQSFEKLRRRDLIYVDKTPYIVPLLRGGGVYFLSRPRRFGKSLFLSTLKAYFEGNKELFDGLALEQAEPALAEREKREAWQQYPILYLDLNGSSYTTITDLENILETHLVEWERLYGNDSAENSFARRFEGVIKRAYQKTGQQVVFLVDEYDKPLLTSVVNEELYEAYRTMLYGLYSNIKNCDRYLRFVFLTGVSRFGKLTIFSGLNNLNDISMDSAYAGICGITEEELTADFAPELKTLASALTLTQDATLAILKKKYDGYMFSETGEHVYNPFSLLNVLQKKQLSDYWYATGTPTFLVKYLKTRHFFIPDLDDDVTMDRDGLQVSPLTTQDSIPILFQTGYLTLREYMPEAGVYRLGFPNEEVKFGFLKNLLTGYSPSVLNAGVEVSKFLREIRAGQVDDFMERLEALIAGIPYDTFAPEVVKYRERDAQVAVYLIFSLMGQFIESEVHSVIGRADAVVHTKEVIYIFEFKLEGTSTPEEALAQIETKGYATPYQKCGKRVIGIGVNFDPEKRNIGGWVKKILGEE